MKMEAGSSRAGFTMVEVLVALTIGLAVLSGVMTSYVWLAKRVSFAEKVSWSHRMALTSERDLLSYMRNAVSIVNVDTNDRAWVELLMPDNTVSRFQYVNPVEFQRDGYMFMTNSSGRHMVIARGMTEIMTAGWSPGIFTPITPDKLRLRYRVVEPVPSRPGENQDDGIGAIVDTIVFMRNGQM